MSVFPHVVIVPLLLLALGVVSFFPEAATDLSDRLAFVPFARHVLTPAASWMARYEWIGAMCLAGGLFLISRRVTRRPAKKPL
jgi:hypothetical protein